MVSNRSLDILGSEERCYFCTSLAPASIPVHSIPVGRDGGGTAPLGTFWHILVKGNARSRSCTLKLSRQQWREQ